MIPIMVSEAQVIGRRSRFQPRENTLLTNGYIYYYVFYLLKRREDGGVREISQALSASSSVSKAGHSIHLLGFNAMSDLLSIHA